MEIGQPPGEDDLLSQPDAVQNVSSVPGTSGTEPWNTTVPPVAATARNASCDTIQFRFILYVCVVGVICLLGFIGNIVSFIVLRKDGSSPVASFQLQVLAVADNVLLFFWANHFILKYLLAYLGVAWVTLPRYMWFWRVYSYPIVFIAQAQTIWLTVVIALNRYIVVRMPLKARYLCTLKNINIQVIAVTVFSVLYNLPRFFEIVPHEEYQNSPNVSSVRKYYYYQPTKLGLNSDYRFIYTDVLYQLVTFALPLLLLAFLNTSVTVAYRGAMVRRRRMSSGTGRRLSSGVERNEHNITLVMIVVVLIFMVSQTPGRIVQLVWGYKYEPCSVMFYVVHVSNILEALNSSVNVVVYFLFRRRFRRILKLLCCGGQSWLLDSDQGMTSHHLMTSVDESGRRTSGKSEMQSL